MRTLYEPLLVSLTEHRHEGSYMSRLVHLSPVLFLPSSHTPDLRRETLPEVMSRLTNLPFFLSKIVPCMVPKNKRFDADFANGIEKVLQDPRQPRASQFDRGFCVDFEKLDLELSGRQFGRRRTGYVGDEKVNAKELECIRKGL